MTKIYWTQRSIPALKGLSFMERHSAMGSVHREVWKHWQVWLSSFLFPIGSMLLLWKLPAFPNKSAVVLCSMLILGRLAILPYYYFLQRHLELRPWRKPSLH